VFVYTGRGQTGVCEKPFCECIHIHVYVYIYIYTCVWGCACVNERDCVCLSTRDVDAKVFARSLCVYTRVREVVCMCVRESVFLVH